MSFTRSLIVFAFLLGIGTPAQETSKPPEQKENRRPGRDSILFKNGDVLFGSLAEIDPENGIQWTRSDAINAFRFAPGMVSELELATSQNHARQISSNYCSLVLSNGDQLEGELLGYDGEKITLNTWFGGTLEFSKTNVAMVLPLGVPKPAIFQGPTGLEGWTMGKVNAPALADAGEWIYQNGAFYALKSASIARDLKLPDSASIQFDLEWRGFFHIAIALYTEYLHPVNLASKETEPKFGGFYSLQINPFSANLLPVKQTEPLRYLGQAPLQSLAQKNSAHVDIRVSKSKRLIALLIDGILIKQWVEPDAEEFAGTGTAMRFVHQGQGAVKLSDLKISEWDGHFEEAVSITPDKSQDLARLKNNDRVIGMVKAIRDGRLSIEVAGRTEPLEVPVARVKQVEFAAAKTIPLVVKPSTIRAFFASGLGRLTFDLERWTDQELAVSSDTFGSVKLNPTAFSRLVFDVNPTKIPTAPKME
jgi:hypothetical protein